MNLTLPLTKLQNVVSPVYGVWICCLNFSKTFLPETGVQQCMSGFLEILYSTK